MNVQPSGVSILIADKEYIVSCPEDEREELLESARFLDERMKETREAGKVLGTERMAVMTALNIVHEMLQQQRTSQTDARGIDDSINGLVAKIDQALSKVRTEPM